MAIDMTQNFIDLDIKTDDWQQQVIDAFEASDLGADVTTSDAANANWNTQEANAHGCVLTSEGKNVKVDGSAFLYVNERVNQKLTNEASGLSSASNLNKNVTSMLQRKLAA